MNVKNIQPIKTENKGAEENSFAAEKPEIAQERKPILPQPMLIAFSVLGVVLMGVAALFWWKFSDGKAGQPVPAPSSVSPDQPTDSAQTFTGQTITIPSEQIESSGIKIETVGEQLTTESVATSATGVVQANSYRETPAISLVGGVVRSVTPELGSHVSRGQTVAVVFSDEYAEAQSRYLALTTQVNNARQNYKRREQLVAINQPGRSEFDEATRRLKIAEAELDEHHQHHARIGKLVELGAASREEFEQSTTKIKSAEAELEEARKRFERSQKLLDINPQTRTELEESANALRSAESERAFVRQKLMLYGMSPQKIDSLRSASQINSEIAVAAPVSGTVTTRAVNAGEVVEANKELLRVTDLSNVWVIAQVFEQSLSRLRTGSGASVTTDAYPDRLFRGQITYIDPRLDEATRTAQVRIELENPGGALKIGTYVRVAFGALGQAEKTVPVIPASAVQNIGSRQIVFAATKEANVFELRSVRLGAETNGQFTVLEGVTVGDKIVTEGSFMLRAEWMKTNRGGAM